MYVRRQTNLELQLVINKPPTPKQSFKMGNGHGYLDGRTKSYMDVVTQQVMAQLPEDFVIIREPMEMRIEHHFQYTNDILKLIKKNNYAGDGAIPRLIKTTRPDVTDNLNKGLIDAMNGWVFIDDALIWRFSASKMYAEVPRSIVRIRTSKNLLIDKNSLFEL